MARPQSRYVCQACGTSHLRWEGQCRGCGAWDTLVETLVRPEPARTVRRTAAPGDPARPRPLAALASVDVERRPTGLGEVDRVLGGGLVPGSVVLLGGEPGIGKSTLVLEVAAGLVRPRSLAAANGASGGTVLYASGEESAGQVRLRAARLGLLEGHAGGAVSVLAETDVERIVEAARQAAPGLLVVDSIQAVSHEGLEGPAGSVGQVREAAARLAEFARATGTPVLIVGHVTKDGSLAGPKTLEHLVDVVLALEGDRYGPLRLLRASKNRFGSTEEVGVFEMAGSGLAEVTDPARAFLTEGSAAAAGSVVAATLEGSRPLLVEVQALVAQAGAGTPRRTVAGLDPNRLALLIAVLGRRAGMAIAGHDIYASLVGGVSVAEPALDLPLALALASSHRDRAVATGTVACGEVGLLGELRPVGGLERRLREAARLGFGRAIVPAGPAKGRPPSVDGLEVVAVGTLREALAAGLGS
ncbi:MAG: DNA repair protein RadA [Candidatus Limnocylindrales bacterium]